MQQEDTGYPFCERYSRIRLLVVVMPLSTHFDGSAYARSIGVFTVNYRNGRRRCRIASVLGRFRANAAPREQQKKHRGYSRLDTIRVCHRRINFVRRNYIIETRSLADLRYRDSDRAWRVQRSHKSCCLRGRNRYTPICLSTFLNAFDCSVGSFQ